MELGFLHNYIVRDLIGNLRHFSQIIFEITVKIMPFIMD